MDWREAGRRLFGINQPSALTSQVATLPPLVALAAPFECSIVGESQYEVSFRAICGPRTEDGVNVEVTAVLVHEDTNRYDPQAVMVLVNGHTVGYLDRVQARVFRAALTAFGLAGRAVTCQARIRGGWDRGSFDRGNYGVRLALRTEAPV